jgi:ERCC4-related helicase
MTTFYHTRKAMGLNVPHILGLTASPVMRSDPNSVNKIEETLDAICRTPTKHRAELLTQVKRPILSEVFYESLPPADSLSGYTKTIASLGQAYGSLKIQDDPYVLWLLKDDTDKSRRALEKVRLNHKTNSTSQMKSFYATTLKICAELGSWAADYYVSEVITKFLKNANDVETSFGGVWDLLAAEKKYLAKTLRDVHITQQTSTLVQTVDFSNKVKELMGLLLAEPPTFRGIVFVQERAVVSVLSHLIATHPETRGRFKIGTIVGMSTHSNRSPEVSELLGVDPETNTLAEFRAGRLNLVIATSVLEEGIDVPSCNVVVCFQKPANLKSFIQRRGRARAQNSKLVLLLDSKESRSTQWQQLETDMKELYENDMRMLRQLEIIEGSEQHDGRCYRVDNTGALLDLDNALPVSNLVYILMFLSASTLERERSFKSCRILYDVGNSVSSSMLTFSIS